MAEDKEITRQVSSGETRLELAVLETRPVCSGSDFSETETRLGLQGDGHLTRLD
jgi:hypothetical protein